ncbi:MAG: bifunctional isocitrate dehydrogenase kinase/phosphatase [Bacteroidia bacterium]|nr:bifunctional isocitrate dehydrogenase kinase/phosphatase [Bacteroidia bacterium]
MQQELIKQVAETIIEAFDAFILEFEKVTANGRSRFENRDWHGIQSDSKKRLNIYKKQVPRLARKIRRIMGAEFSNMELWHKIKKAYAPLSQKKFAYEIAETYFNSVCRKTVDNFGADEDVMFVHDEHNQREYASVAPIYRTYFIGNSLEGVFAEILDDYAFEAPYKNKERDLASIVGRFEEEVLMEYPYQGMIRLEVLKSVFFRNKGAYIVGRVIIGKDTVPMMLVMLHGEDGIEVDTLLTTEGDLSIVFSFTRSYFLVSVAIPSELVHFLRSVMPYKPYSDIYNSIGFNKHGKTESFRHFAKHLENTDDLFVHAPGIKGMVMAVFTLPSYNLVFKLIKDRFEPPKVTNKAHVKSCYKLVSRHDRVGRMADTHEFEFFTLPKDRFQPELLEDLLKVAPSIVHVDEDKDQVVIDHLYTERRMTPLNIFLEDVQGEDADEVIDEYGNTIKQLAAANIFPGDMLLKNFGVTRHKRVVFYDYDEIGFLTDYNFRKLPEAQYDGDEMYDDGGRPWFAVGPNDVFPEEFRHFLIGKEAIRKIFFNYHKDLFDPKFWKEMQQKQIKGEIVDVFPYRRRKRFIHQREAQRRSLGED